MNVRKEYEPSIYCVTGKAHKDGVCLQCGRCGRRFRKGILVDNTGKEFVRHTDEYMRKENDNERR